MRTVTAFVPARAGSKRIPGKALADLGGRPMIEYTLAAAYGAGLRIVVATDSEDVARYAHRRGAERYVDLSIYLRPESADDEPDISWVRAALEAYPEVEDLAILRPTSPFRSSATVRWALALWRTVGEDVDSARMVTPAPIHPGKTWRVIVVDSASSRLVPFVAERRDDGVPWHSSPTQSLPAAYVQTGGLELIHRRTVEELGSIAGVRVMPLIVDGLAALDVNTPEDLERARLVHASLEEVPL